jgi:hypothetical protein
VCAGQFARGDIIDEILAALDTLWGGTEDHELVSKAIRHAFWVTLTMEASWLVRLSPFVARFVDPGRSPSLSERDEQILIAFIDDGIPGLSLVREYLQDFVRRKLH